MISHCSGDKRVPRLFLNFLRSSGIASCLRLDVDPLDLIEARADLWVQLNRRLNGCLSMKLGGKGNLEEDILHNIRGEWSRDRDRLAAKQYIAKTPRPR